MARLNLKAVEERVAPLAGRESYDRGFIFELLLAYGKPQSSITRLRNGDLNAAADKSTEVAQKKVVYFKETTGDPLEVLETLKTSPDIVRFSTRFVIVTDFAELVAHDTQTGETIGLPRSGRSTSTSPFSCPGQVWRKRSTSPRPTQMLKPLSAWANSSTSCWRLLRPPCRTSSTTTSTVCSTSLRSRRRPRSSDRLERAFLEIVEFRRTHDRLPSSSTREIAERKLGARLDGILANDSKIEALKHLDTEFELLAVDAAPESLDDLLESDDLDDLLGDESGILDVSALPVIKRPESPDSVAQRVKSEDFDAYEPLFRAMHLSLAEGLVKQMPFTGLDLIREGAFFVLSGVMCFVAEIGDDVDLVVGGKPKQKQRLKVVFENGTESAMYKQSLMTRLYEAQGQVLVRAELDENSILDADVESGHIYVLQSLSTDPLIANMKDLHKIEFSTTSVEMRIKNAENSPTYLMAPVKVLADYRLYNTKASWLENLLHRVFADVRLDLTQVDKKGRDYDPSEWFVVPLETINKAVAMILSGEITEYVYDKAQQKLVERSTHGG